MLKLIQKITFITSAIFVLSSTSITAQSCVEYSTDTGGRLALNTGGSTEYVQTLVQYATVVGYQDLFNSRGARLTDIFAVMQQDRANVNRFNKPDRTDFDGADLFVDNRDSFFTTAERRALFQQMTYAGFCFEDAADIRAFKNRLVNANTIYLFVSVFTFSDGRLGLHISEAG